MGRARRAPINASASGATSGGEQGRVSSSRHTGKVASGTGRDRASFCARVRQGNFRKARVQELVGMDMVLMGKREEC
jgi:hypothetical protein